MRMRVSTMTQSNSAEGVRTPLRNAMNTPGFDIQEDGEQSPMPDADGYLGNVVPWNGLLLTWRGV